jgi:hypothetical protein
MNVGRAVFLMLLASAWAACVVSGSPGQPLDVAAMVRSKPRSLLVVHFPTPRFLGRPRMLQNIGGRYIEGEGLRETYAIVDPAIELGTEIGEELSQRHALELLSYTAEAPHFVDATDSRSNKRTPRPKADLALEVRTTGWGIFDSEQHTVYYEVMARLIDSRSLRVLALGSCGAMRPDPNLRIKEPGAVRGKPATSYDDLLDDDGALLKGRLASAIEECATDLRSKLFLLVEAQPVPAPAKLEAKSPVVDAGVDGAD